MIDKQLARSRPLAGNKLPETQVFLNLGFANPMFSSPVLSLKNDGSRENNKVNSASHKKGLVSRVQTQVPQC